MCIFALARTTWIIVSQYSISCELLQNVYLCISTYNSSKRYYILTGVVNCFKMCIFALARTTSKSPTFSKSCCELLQNVYLCISTYNTIATSSLSQTVVNCFKMCIFALARTTVCISVNSWRRCELLQNVYLCISTYNFPWRNLFPSSVVNCFKMCIFALARTTGGAVEVRTSVLWIASKCVSLH